MRRALLIVLVIVLVAIGLAAAGLLAFRGGSEEASGEPIRVTSPTGSSTIVSIGGQSTSEPVARLPGITVLGFGEVEVKPDVALIRLTVGSGSSFGGSDGSVQLIDEKEIEPIVDALVAAGADKDEMYVNTFTGSSFGPSQAAAVITFKWPRPEGAREVIQTAQRAIRQQTDYDLQQVAVVFGRDACDAPEEEAMGEALADARKRAERLASLSDAKLGRLVAVSEATSASYLAAFVPQRCGASELLAPGLFEYQTVAATADEVKVSMTLEVTFSLDE